MKKQVRGPLPRSSSTQFWSGPYARCPDFSFRFFPSFSLMFFFSDLNNSGFKKVPKFMEKMNFKNQCSRNDKILDDKMFMISKKSSHIQNKFNISTKMFGKTKNIRLFNNCSWKVQRFIKKTHRFQKNVQKVLRNI